MKSQISIVIPNYNGKQLLERNLPKVIDAAHMAEIIVVDDCSTDDSLQVLDKFGSRIKVVKREKNQGFASSVNDGVKNASGELVVLLNSDVYPTKQFLSHLTRHFQDERVFAVGCMQTGGKWEGKKKQGRGKGEFRQGFVHHSWASTEKSDTLWVFAGASMYRKKIWDKLGGMDTLYNPFYWEDIDISYRALKAGKRLVFEQKSLVFHRQSEGSIRSRYLQKDIKTIAYRNQFLFVWLNITDINMIFQHLLYLPYHLAKAIYQKDWAFIKSFFMSVILLPSVAWHRKRNIKNSIITDKEILDRR